MLNKGQILNNRYKIQSVLGQGGFGAVYKVWDDNLLRNCALKENLQVSADSQRQFKREAIILANLNHPHLVRVTDYFVIPDKGQYLVMDFVDGDDLQTILSKNRGPLPEGQVLPWIEQVCDALIYIHNQAPPIIHRDIKPANIRITPQGNAILVDFGLAKIFDKGIKTSMGARGLTPHYAAPEQYGTGGTDAQSDIYSLGVTLYCLLTYHLPSDSVEIVVGNADPAPLANSLIPTIPESISNALQGAMQVRRTDRYKTVSEFKTALLTKGKSSAPVGKVEPPAGEAADLGGHKIGSSDGEERAHVPAGQPAPLADEMQDAKVTIDENVSDTIKVPRELDSHKPVPGSKPISSKRSKEPAKSSNLLRYLPVMLGLILLGWAGMQIWDRLTPAKTAIPTERPFVTEAPPFTESPIVTEVPIIQDEITDANVVEMRYVPAGNFTMGSNDGLDAEKPVHTVFVEAFYMDMYEVTNALYSACVEAGACTPPHETSSYIQSSYYGTTQFADYPVINVDWNQAKIYCEWRGARLPTEAEWEKAARGTDGRIYPWGNDSPNSNLLNFAQNVGDTSQVGSYPRGISPYGIFDLAGNVWEWVADWYDAYPGNTTNDSDFGTTYRVLRGGSWIDYTNLSRASFRNWYDPDLWIGVIGFRCARGTSP